jgi:hypothetical protein
MVRFILLYHKDIQLFPEILLFELRGKSISYSMLRNKGREGKYIFLIHYNGFIRTDREQKQE